MAIFHVYILYSPTYNKYYIGQTNDLKYRLKRHNEGEERLYTSKYRPWVLFTSLELETRSQAMRVEKYLKKKGRDFIRRIKEDEDLRVYILERFKK